MKNTAEAPVRLYKDPERKVAGGGGEFVDGDVHVFTDGGGKRSLSHYQ